MRKLPPLKFKHLFFGASVAVLVFVDFSILESNDISTAWFAYIVLLLLSAIMTIIGVVDILDTLWNVPIFKSKK